MKKIKYSNILLSGVFIYILFQLLVSFMGNNTEVLTLENEVFEAKLNAKGLIIRDEHLVKSNDTGELELLVKEGEKIKKSQEIAKIYRGKISTSIDKDIEQLDLEISKLKNGEDNLAQNEISNLNKEINLISDSIQTSILTKKYRSISNYKDEINDLIEERNRLLNNSIDGKQLETKEGKKEILTRQIQNNVTNLTSDIAGIVSYKIDGNEEKYNYDKLKELTKKDIEEADNKFKEIDKDKSAIKEGNSIMRIINNYSTYVAISLDKEQSKNFAESQEVVLKWDSLKFEATVDQIYDDGDNKIVLLKITNQNIGIYDTRVAEFDIIYKKVEGLKVDKRAIDNVDKKQGVYVVDEETRKVKFVPIEGVVYEDNDYVVVDYYNNNINGIQSVDLYDRIIAKPNSINKNMMIK